MNNFDLNGLKNSSRSASRSISRRSGNIFVFIPGVLLVAVAMSLVFAPRLLLSLVAGFFLFFGAMALIAGWKLLQFKRRLEEGSKIFQPKIFIQGLNIRSQDGLRTNSDEVTKKTVFH
jgi:hypothetical protein